MVLGYAAEYIGFDKDVWLDTVASTVPPKTVEINQKAFLCGYGAEMAYKIVPYPVVMRRALVLFREEYGSIDGYLDEIGFSNADREKIRRKFVTTP